MNKQGQKKTLGPDPKRYDIKSKLDDDSGFRVIGINHAFKYDQHGGWYDEYGNYYNKDDKPASHPIPANKEEHKSTTQSAHEPDPKRFENFTLLPDETGFKVEGSDHIFYFDIYGGWYDEHDNYYDADANPCTPPDYSEEENPADRLLNEYVDDSDEDKDDEHLAHFDDIYYNAENKKVLASYLKDQDVHITITNVNYKSTEDEFEKFLVENKIEWINFEFELNNKGQFNGTCYVELEKSQAEKLVSLNGHTYKGRDLKIVVERPEEGEEEEEESDHEHHEEGEAHEEQKEEQA